MRRAIRHTVVLSGGHVDYSVVVSETARRLRVRVGPRGVEVLVPPGTCTEDASAILRRNEAWVLAQLARVSMFQDIRRASRTECGKMLYGGEPTPVRIELVDWKARGNFVEWKEGEIVVRRGIATRTPAVRGLENWLRRQARAQIGACLPALTQQLGRSFGRVYVMGQRTKWGNCSSRRNLSFNWRLILAPDAVLHYLVAHEVAHLAVPDHSAKFWLTVQSLCPEMERAKQWLSRHHASLTVDLGRVVNLPGGLGCE